MDPSVPSMCGPRFASQAQHFHRWLKLRFLIWMWQEQKSTMRSLINLINIVQLEFPTLRRLVGTQGKYLVRDDYKVVVCLDVRDSFWWLERDEQFESSRWIKNGTRVWSWCCQVVWPVLLVPAAKLLILIGGQSVLPDLVNGHWCPGGFLRTGHPHLITEGILSLAGCRYDLKTIGLTLR